MDKKVLGVCAWIATKTDTDVAIIRIIFVAAVLFLGTGILAYLVIFLLRQFGILD